MSLKVFSVHASRLFERNLRALLEVSFVSLTSAGSRRLHLEGLDLQLVLQGSPLVLPLCDLLQLAGFSGWFWTWTSSANLFFFGCLTSSVSPGLIPLDFVPSFEPAYTLIFDFCSHSAIVFIVSCKVCCLAGSGYISGRVVLSFLPFSASFGDTFVVACSVARYCLRILYSFCVQFFPQQQQLAHTSQGLAWNVLPCHLLSAKEEELSCDGILDTSQSYWTRLH